jgi:hypothetical protein
MQAHPAVLLGNGNVTVKIFRKWRRIFIVTSYKIVNDVPQLYKL